MKSFLAKALVVGLFAPMPWVRGQAAIPFFDDFNTGSAQAEWILNGATVAGTGGMGNSMALDTAGHSVVVPFLANSEGIVWTHFQIKPALQPVGSRPEIREGTEAALFFNTDGEVEVLNGSSWETISPGMNLEQLLRVSVATNYATGKWALWINGLMISEDLTFAENAQQVRSYDGFRCSMAADLLDDLKIDSDVPFSGYKSWELSQLWADGADTSPAGDGDNDSLTNLEEFVYNTDPTDNRSHYSPIVSSFETTAAGETRFRLTTRRNISLGNDMQITVLTSPDLMNAFAPASFDLFGPPAVIPGDPHTELITFEVNMGAADSMFFRLEFSEVAPL